MKQTHFGQIPRYIGRPFTGAWIETMRMVALPRWAMVAPSRGRGLKLLKN